MNHLNSIEFVVVMGQPIEDPSCSSFMLERFCKESLYYVANWIDFFQKTLCNLNVCQFGTTVVEGLVPFFSTFTTSIHYSNAWARLVGTPWGYALSFRASNFLSIILYGAILQF